VGAAATVALVALCTLLLYPLEQAAPAVSLGVVYMVAVLIVSYLWGLPLGIAAAVLSALAFNYFHLPPVGRFTIRNPENWVALVTFTVTALLASSMAELMRARTREAQERRREADLAAEMARVLLRGERLGDALPAAGARLAGALDIPSATIVQGRAPGGARRIALPLREGERVLGTLLVPADLPGPGLRRLRERVVPALEGLLSAALEREALLADVVETAALRRADAVKTALLRTVSHDFRSPLTAIGAAGEALGSDSLDPADRGEMAAVVREETRRLSRLVEDLLDLSRLEAGAAEPRVAVSPLAEVIDSAISELAPRAGELVVSVPDDLPPVSADPAQLERALVNVIDNARRHSGGHPVAIRARAARRRAGGDGETRLVVRIVDRGPGIPAAEMERIFEPFYRARADRGRPGGSGLGLAIARGFAEASGGQLRAESLPGQGATFVFELPSP
jgi:two-component system sensor histidine kinase KdpD